MYKCIECKVYKSFLLCYFFESHIFVAFSSKYIVKFVFFLLIFLLQEGLSREPRRVEGKFRFSPLQNDGISH